MYFVLKSGENTKILLVTILQVLKAINGGIIILSKCGVCSDKKPKFIKKQGTSRLLNNLFIKKILRNILILRDILF